MFVSKSKLICAAVFAQAFFLSAQVGAQDIRPTSGSQMAAFHDLGQAELQPLTDTEMDTLRGARGFRSFFSRLIEALGTDNQTSITINDNPTETSSGSGTQTASFDDGRTTVEASAGPGTSTTRPPRMISRATTRTRMRTRSFSFRR